MTIRSVPAMISPTSVTERLLFTTFRIETRLASGLTGTGTGFLFHFRLDDTRHLPVIITNKHVIEGAVTGKFQLHEADTVDGQIRPTGRFFDVQLEDFEKRWFPHQEASVDLCAMLFQPIRAEAEKAGKRVFAAAFDDSILPTDALLSDLTAVEDILIAGYPTGLWDESNNLPLIRRGITASHPAMDYCGRPEFVVDAACFPDSSGSPVVLVNNGVYIGKKGELQVGGGRYALLGVLYAGPQWTAEGKVVQQPIPATYQPVSMTKVMIHLGYVVKAREIVALGEQLRQAWSHATTSILPS